jgi:hypothetical protein
MKTHNATMFLRAGVLLAVALTLSKRERRWGEAEPSRVRLRKMATLGRRGPCP